MANPTKQELRDEIHAILKDADLAEMAAKKVRLQLEQNLKCSLAARKKEVDELVMQYVNSRASSGEEDEDSDEDYDNGKGKSKRNTKASSDYEDEKDDDDEDDDDDDDDYSEEEKPKGRKSVGKRGTPAKRGPVAKKKKRTSDSEDDGSGGSDDKDEDYKPQKGAKGAKAKPAKGRKNASDSDSDAEWKRPKPKLKKAKKAAADGTGAKKGSGFTRPYTLSADLAALCGAESLPRHEVVKKIWAIIKERKLYDPKNKQYAICDPELQKVIGVKRFRTFGMLKYLKQHFID